MNTKVLSQVLCERSSHFTSNQWEEFMEELANKNLYLCIEAASTAQKFVSSDVMIPITNKNDQIKIYSGEELKRNNLTLNHQFISVANSNV